jgi:hypothetical protein
MQKISDWASKSVWRTVLCAPLLIAYAVWKIPGALKEWGQS